MTQRTNHFKNAPELSKRLMELSGASGKSSLGHGLIALIDIRASQMNGCAFCLDMHVKQAKLYGERGLRVYHVSIWRESPLFSEKERAALAMTEALTHLPVGGLGDELYEQVRTHFSESELSDLTYAIGLINLWNRLQITARPIPGSLDAEYGLTEAGLI